MTFQCMPTICNDQIRLIGISIISNIIICVGSIQILSVSCFEIRIFFKHSCLLCFQMFKFMPPDYTLKWLTIPSAPSCLSLPSQLQWPLLHSLWPTCLASHISEAMCFLFCGAFCLMVHDLFHFKLCFPAPPMLLQMTYFHLCVCC